MSDIHLVTSPRCGQKCLVSVERFKAMQCRLGGLVRAVDGDTGRTLICEVWPRQELNDVTVICEDSVEVYSQRHYKILRKKTYRADEAPDHPLTLLVGSKATEEMTVTVVTETAEAAVRLQRCRLSVLVKDLLADRIFAPLSAVRVDKVMANTGIVSILVLASSPPSDALHVTRKTTIHVETVVTRTRFEQLSRAPVVALAGVDLVLAQLHDRIVLPLRYPEAFTTRGVLLVGASGSGKSQAVRQLCYHHGLHLVTLTGADLVSSQPGESEQKLGRILDETVAECRRQDAATVLFLDHVEALCPKPRGHGHGDRVSVAVATLFDGLERRAPLVVVGATSWPDDVDPALRRPGRFDREIYFGVPDAQQRRLILAAHCRALDLVLDVGCRLEDVANATPGYLGADLGLLCREVAFQSEEKDCVTFDDFKKALGAVRPPLHRQDHAASDFRKVSWDQVGGLQEVQMYLRRTIEWPLKHPEAFVRFNVPPPKGVLLYGPPGCGKSLTVRAVATSCDVAFVSASAAELFSSYVGDSEKRVAALFRRARLAAPCILFLDELDAVVGARSSSSSSSGGRTAQLGVIATLLQEMDGVAACRDVIVVAATNRPDKIDAALMRPGRFDAHVYVPNPDRAARLAVLRAVTARMALAADVDLDDIADRTDLFSGADLEWLLKEAAMVALEESMETSTVSQRHLSDALLRVRPSLGVDQLEFYRRFARTGRVDSS